MTLKNSMGQAIIRNLTANEIENATNPSPNFTIVELGAVAFEEFDTIFDKEKSSKLIIKSIKPKEKKEMWSSSLVRPTQTFDARPPIE